MKDPLRVAVTDRGTLPLGHRNIAEEGGDRPLVAEFVSAALDMKQPDTTQSPAGTSPEQ
jgi:hypothetical protein